MMEEVSSKDEVDISLLTAELYVCMYVCLYVLYIIVSRKCNNKADLCYIQRIEIEFLEFRIFPNSMIFSYVGGVSINYVQWKDHLFKRRKGNDKDDACIRWCGVSHNIRGKKSKKEREVRCREAMLVTKIQAASPKGLLQVGRKDLNVARIHSQIQHSSKRDTCCGGNGSTNC